VIDPRQPLREGRDAWVRNFERRYLHELLRVHQNNVSSAARTAGLDRPYLHRLLRRYGLR
jgi:transcriptional regulator of acetoin/glycerol metabolism